MEEGTPPAAATAMGSPAGLASPSVQQAGTTITNALDDAFSMIIQSQIDQREQILLLECCLLSGGKPARKRQS
jgi:hypothetical protein